MPISRSVEVARKMAPAASGDASEALSEAVICVILIWQLQKPHREGRVIGLYGLLYGLVRFSVEFLREHDTSNPLGGPFTLEQWISLGLAAAGLGLIIRSFKAAECPTP